MTEEEKLLIELEERKEDVEWAKENMKRARSKLLAAEYALDRIEEKINPRDYRDYDEED
jgi:hypothetical protein